MTDLPLALVLPAVLAVAALYASVGHGGASGYLAVMALAGVAAERAAPGALVLNLAVAGVGAVAFAHAGHLRASLLLPFALGSIPLALVGGAIRIPTRAYDLLLAAALVSAAARMALRTPEVETTSGPPPVALALPCGAAIGLLSGLVGVGGGIFLSPLLLLARWATAKETAAVSAAFIVLNSAAGLAGRGASGRLELAGILPLVVAALLGGTAGSLLGARKLRGTALRRVLAFVLLLASGKLAWQGARG